MVNMISAIFAREAITADNLGPVVSVVAWSLVAAVVLCAVLKVVLGSLHDGHHLDDTFTLIAMVFSIAQTATTSVQVVNGVGRHMNTLTEKNLRVYQQTGYATEIFFILALLASKLSTVSFTYQLSQDKRHRRASIVVGAFIVVWCATSLLVSICQCAAPAVWSILNLRGQCIDQVVFWTVFAVLNILTEMALIALPSAVVIESSLDLERKLVVVTTFMTRLATIAAIAVQIYLLCKPSIMHGGDYTFAIWPYVLAQNVVQSMAVITVCIPYLRGMLIGMESGMFQTGHVRRRQASTIARAVRKLPRVNAVSAKDAVLIASSRVMAAKGDDVVVEKEEEEDGGRNSRVC